MLYEDIMKEFIFDCQVRNLSSRTIRSYRQNSNSLFHYLKVEYDINDIEDVTHKHIQLYFKYLREKGLKETYINSILKSLRAFYKYCVEEEYVYKNPCLKVKWQKEKTPVIETFTDQEIIKMLNVYNYNDYLSARNKAIFATLVDTGIRNLELCKLLKQNINELNILVDGKGYKERYVPISPMLKKVMIKYERIRDFFFMDKLIGNDNYFLSRTAKPLTVETVERVVKFAGEQAGVRSKIRCSPHTLRHYFSQTQLKNGLDVYSLSRLLGHESITITKRYLQSIQDKEILDLSIKTSPLMNLR